jgi:hypothetical protein
LWGQGHGWKYVQFSESNIMGFGTEDRGR